jgi:hypothetical protein
MERECRFSKVCRCICRNRDQIVIQLHENMEYAMVKLIMRGSLIRGVHHEQKHKSHE